ncbi:hypothetical protein D3C73_1321770 [compost metagenome]
MRARFIAQEIKQARRAVGHFLHGRVLGVQHAQRVRVQAALTVFIENVAVLFQVLDQRGAVRRAFGGLPQGIQLQTHIRQTQQLPQAGQHDDKLGVHIRTDEA